MKRRLLHLALLALLTLPLFGGPTPTRAASRSLNPAAPDATWTDSYGYVLSNTATVDWYDASTDGAPLFTPSWGGQVSPATALPFDFTFYGKDCPAVYISTNGVISCNAIVYSDVEFHKPLPLSKFGNNLIAPLWSYDIFINATTSNVYYHTYDDPNHIGKKIFVIQWKVLDPGVVLSFEVQLFEYKSQIAFQYNVLETNYVPLTYSVGIEDKPGRIGLQYPNAVVVGTGLTFTPPDPGPRGSLLPLENGALTSSGHAVVPLRLSNNGDWGDDIYTIGWTSSEPGWTAVIYDPSTGLPLPNHTPNLSIGETLRLSVRITAPSDADPGATTRFTVTATSTADSSKSVKAYIDAAVPTEFAQIFVDAEISLRQIWKENVITRKLADEFTGTNLSMEAVSPEKYLAAWEERGAVMADGQILEGVKALGDGRYSYRGEILAPGAARPFTDIRYRLSHVTAGPGATRSLANVDQLVAGGPTLSEAHASTPVITPVNTLSSSSNILAVWYLSKMRASDSKFNANLYMTVLNSNGNPVLSQPFNVTGDGTWQDDLRVYLSPNVLSLGDGKFAVCWINQSDHKIRCSFFELNGSTLSRIGSVHLLEANTDTDYQPFELSVTALTDSTMLLLYNALYMGSDTSQPAHKLYFQVINSSGDELKEGTLIDGANGVTPRSVQMGDDRALAVWAQYDGRLGYIRINNMDLVETEPKFFARTYGRSVKNPSVAVNARGYTIITWVDGDASEYIFYTLLSNTAGVITQPMSMLSNPFANPTYITSTLGFGNARYSGVYLVSLPMLKR